MSILNIVFVLVLVGVLLWAINSFIPMEASIKKLLNIVVVCVLVFWLLKVFGVLSYLSSVHF